VRVGGVIANRSTDTDQIDRYNDRTGLARIAHVRDLDVVRRSRLKKSTLFEMESSPEVDSVQREFLALADRLWEGVDGLSAQSLPDREIFELLGYE
jgi:light-independent protochlorophyllide reductase subunit L